MKTYKCKNCQTPMGCCICTYFIKIIDKIGCLDLSYDALHFRCTISLVSFQLQSRVSMR